MSNLIIRVAVQADLPILKEFEQGIITTERPFNDSLKSEPICYYDISALIDGDSSSVMVAEDNGVIVGSGYVRIRESKAHLKQVNSSANQMEEVCERVSRHKTPNENSLRNALYYLIVVY